MLRPDNRIVKAGDKPSARSHNKLTALANSFAVGRNIQGLANATGYHNRRSPAPNPIRVAYCKADAGAGATLVCYLDTDASDEEVTVNFSIAQANFNLNACLPLLANGDIIFVSEIRGVWWCLQTFNPSKECDCYTEP